MHTNSLTLLDILAKNDDLSVIAHFEMMEEAGKSLCNNSEFYS